METRIAELREAQGMKRTCATIIDTRKGPSPAAWAREGPYCMEG